VLLESTPLIFSPLEGKIFTFFWHDSCSEVVFIRFRRTWAVGEFLWFGQEPLMLVQGGLTGGSEVNNMVNDCGHAGRTLTNVI